MRVLAVAVAVLLVGCYGRPSSEYRLSDVRGVVCRVNVDDVSTEVFIPYRQDVVVLCDHGAAKLMSLATFFYDFMPANPNSAVLR